MDLEARTRQADRLIADLARVQFGVVARWQLTRAGVSDEQVTTRIAAGRLHLVHRGVYLVGHEVAPERAMESAALLAFRGRGTLSHWSAAALWGIEAAPPRGPVCVTVPPGTSTARPGIRVHRARLAQREIERVDGLALTAPLRTVLDCAWALSRGARRRSGRRREQRDPLAPERLSRLEQLVAQAEYRGLVNAAELRAELAKRRGRRGVAALRLIVGEPGGPQRARSGVERRMITRLRGAGLSGFEANARVHGYEVDLLWRRECFAVEVDGWEGHSGRVAFERDRVKIATLAAHGVQVMPVTPDEFDHDPGVVVARIARALASRTPSA